MVGTLTWTKILDILAVLIQGPSPSKDVDPEDQTKMRLLADFPSTVTRVFCPYRCRLLLVSCIVPQK